MAAGLVLPVAAGLAPVAFVPVGLVMALAGPVHGLGALVDCGVAAAGLARARTQDATRSFGMFSCSKASNEVNFLAQKFVRSVMGSNNIDSCNRT